MVARTRLGRRMAWATLAGGTLVALFWTLYFTRSIALAEGDAGIDAFESAFVLADGALTLTLFGAGRALLAGRPAGPFLLVAAGAMCLYLGLLDVAFYAKRGFYTPLTTTGAVELAINALCLGGGAFALRCGWTLWRAG